MLLCWIPSHFYHGQAPFTVICTKWIVSRTMGGITANLNQDCAEWHPSVTSGTEQVWARRRWEHSINPSEVTFLSSACLLFNQEGNPQTLHVSSAFHQSNFSVAKKCRKFGQFCTTYSFELLTRPSRNAIRILSCSGSALCLITCIFCVGVFTDNR